ncbi:MAG TPA: hypothetical protein VFJ18_12225 [Pararhizobium sp.]|nr:hypothetical protein [Pararhizobium sp.]
MNIALHGVTKIELCTRYRDNSNSRTIRITAADYLGHEFETELTVYGNTDALDALPKSDDFRDEHHRSPVAA